MGSSADAPGPVASLDESRPETAALSAPSSLENLSCGRFLQLQGPTPHLSAPVGVHAPVPVSEFLFKTCRVRCDHAVETCPCRDTAPFVGCSRELLSHEIGSLPCLASGGTMCFC